MVKLDLQVILNLLDQTDINKKRDADHSSIELRFPILQMQMGDQ